MQDPSIPRSRAGANRGPRPPAVTSGEFVKKGGKIVLHDRRGNTYTLPHVQVLSGTFGFDEEGMEKFPRATEYDATGAVKVQGDKLLVFFLDDNPRRPLVMGGVRSVTANAFFARDSVGQGDPNQLRVRLRPLTAAGTEGGRVEAVFCKDGTGTVEVTATHGLSVSVGGMRLNITSDGVTLDGSEIKLGAAATESVPLGDAMKTWLDSHVHPSAGAPPSIPFPAAALSTTAKVE